MAPNSGPAMSGKLSCSRLDQWLTCAGAQSRAEQSRAGDAGRWELGWPGPPGQALPARPAGRCSCKRPRATAPARVQAGRHSPQVPAPQALQAPALTLSVGRKWPGQVWPQPRKGCSRWFSKTCHGVAQGVGVGWGGGGGWWGWGWGAHGFGVGGFARGSCYIISGQATRGARPPAAGGLSAPPPPCLPTSSITAAAASCGARWAGMAGRKSRCAAVGLRGRDRGSGTKCERGSVAWLGHRGVLDRRTPGMQFNGRSREPRQSGTRHPGQPAQARG